ncbi:MAG: molybdopterin-dependent oxidoreductase, partial [Eggerthellaceae bacterium]|nr:molybdopterin-dependent oxidoreductase [Eggerthellaceae bacterium]
EQAEGLSDNEVNHAEVVVVWGAQPSVSETAESGRGMAELRAHGVKTIVVDPNFSPDAAKATVWLPVRPQTDPALILSWYRYIFENELYNEEFTKYWTNLPFLIHQDPDNPRYKLPVYANEIWPDYVSPTPEDTPVYACYDLKTNSVQPFVYSLPKDSEVDPEIFWEGEYEGVTYKTAGQIYKEEAEPWTLEKTEEVTYVPADRNEAAIRLYTHADDDGTVAGIVNGVASDMNEFASQVPIGVMGLDGIMGYINKPGATMTTYGDTTPTSRQYKYANGFGGMFSDMYGVGAVVGMSDAQNEARIKELGEVMPDSQRILNKLLVDRLGMRDHKGLYEWCHSHIPTVREAIETGEPYRPRVWFDMSGNKLAMLGNAKSWYAVFPDVDFIIGQYPMMTSFHVEAADLVFPLGEWLEEPMVNMNQLGTLWLENACTHIGETVSHGVPAGQTIIKLREMYGGHIPNGLELGDGTAYLGNATEADNKQEVAETLYAPDWDTLQANLDEYVPYVPEDYWHYNQQETIVDDGLPVGFATESRKLEPYFQILIRMARTGYPYCYPNEQQACEDYSPICTFKEPCESPYSDAEQQLADQADYPLIITSGRVPYFHHGTMRHSAFARELYPVPEVKMNPRTAAELGIEHMDWVKVTSRRGSIHGRAYLTEGLNPEYVWMERFWNPECFDDSVPEDQQTAGWRECNINVLTKNTAPFNEVFGSYTNRGFTVRVEKDEKPDLVWVEPEEFRPFMPTLTSEPQTEDVF